MTLATIARARPAGGHRGRNGAGAALAVNGSDGSAGRRDSIPALWQLADAGAQVVRLTVGQYHQMIRTGVLPEGEPIELLDGMLVRKDRAKEGEDPMMVGPDHFGAVERLMDLRARFKRAGCWLRVQGPATLPPYNEPEPDGAVVRGGPEGYAGRHPGAKDILCAIEVSDSSLRRDRTVKQRIYADRGIPQYVLVNLVERVVEVYTRPLAGQGRYGQVVILGPRQKVEFNTGGKKPLVVPVRSLLP